MTKNEKALATTTARGETLFFDGYRAEPYAERPGVYAVYQPEGRKIPKGSALWYDVDIINQDCQCAAFERLGRCKHLLALNKAIADALRLVSPMLPQPEAPKPAPAPVFASQEEFERRRALDFD